MTDYSEESLAARIRDARDSVVRLEGRPAYDVGGAEATRLLAWMDGRPRPERSIRTDPYLRLVAEVTGRGVAWERIRLIGDPPTEYEEFQLIGYAEAAVVGEQVLIGRRPLDWSTPDVWLVDWDTAVELYYSPAGEPTGMRLVDDVAGVNRIIGAVEYARCLSVPFAEFVAPSAPRRAAG